MLCKSRPTHHRRVTRRSWSHTAFGTALALVLVGCAGGTGPTAAPSAAPATAGSVPSRVPASPTPAPSPSPTPTATPVPTPEPSLPADAAPQELRGTWANQDDTTNLRLLIQPTTYRITRFGNSGSGSISITDDVARFFGSNLCAGVGEYRWRLVDGVLTFDPVAPDECPGRADGIEGVSFVLLFPPA